MRVDEELKKKAKAYNVNISELVRWRSGTKYRREKERTDFSIGTGEEGSIKSVRQ